MQFVSGSRYIRAFLVLREKIKEWVRSHVGAWDHRVIILSKISTRHTQTDYSSLWMLLQIEWQYLQITVPKVDTLMEPIDTSLSEAFFPLLFGME